MGKNQYRTNGTDNFNGKQEPGRFGKYDGRYEQQTRQTQREHQEHQEQQEHRVRPGYPQPEGKVVKDKEQTGHEQILDRLERQIDEDAAGIGIVVAEVFKTLAMAHGALPSMDLKTDLFHIVVNEACISVDVFNPDCVECPSFPVCCDEDHDEDHDCGYDGGFGGFGDFDDEEDGYEFDD